ncbi:hypothetical protein [Sphaerotilus microaerophilus]|uniref:Uncharacterized protein n=1 Tax=Sphaerotilus microaerophilus TaxID=2914710 RepID=A0ABM7YJ91_9BURK|nr:hypothetical protein [Sphaerotilus sp. FB-5]BDI04297.1 hypothetical protein CATMQ487_12670 [Sphaerotilus sp. FB-5]
MPRCVLTPPRRRQFVGLLLVGLCSVGTLCPAQEQVQRSFPAQALRGTLKVVDAPDVLLNGSAARLAPGARIRDKNNLLVMSAAIAGQALGVHYTHDFDGLIKDVWIIRSDEAARFWPRSAAEAATYTFDPAGQTWTR